MNLTPQQEKIRQHWEKFRPKMYQELQQKGQLQKSLENADNWTREGISDLVEKGLPLNQAKEMMNEQWAFLPAETEEPKLGIEPSQMPLQAPITE